MFKDIKRLILISLILVNFVNCFKINHIPGSENWSENQGYMNWRNAKTKCESIGMRLPTRKELEEANAAGITKAWEKELRSFGSVWSEDYTEDYSLTFYIDTQNVFINHKVNWETDVYCIKKELGNFRKP